MEIINESQVEPRRLQALIRLISYLEAPKRQELFDLLQPTALMERFSRRNHNWRPGLQTGLLWITVWRKKMMKRCSDYRLLQPKSRRCQRSRHICKKVSWRKPWRISQIIGLISSQPGMLCRMSESFTIFQHEAMMLLSAKRSFQE